MDDDSALKECTVRDELTKLGIPAAVASTANGIYIKSGKHFGSNNQKRLALLYDCCYNAYIKMDIPINPIELGTKIGISSKLSTIVKDENVYIDPSVYFDEFCSYYTFDSDDLRILEEVGAYLDENAPPTTAIIAGLATIIILFDILQPEWWNASEKKRLIEKSKCNATTLKNAINKMRSKMEAAIKNILRV